MEIDCASFNSLWSSLVIEELIRNGIDYFCISPGSRSAPLAIAAARHPSAKQLICHDERAAAFHAVGYSRASGKSAVLICTSGTAAANYYPAVIEAAMDRLPMIILSADRPPELQQTGANQTIQQQRLFGAYAKGYFEIPCPAATVPAKMLLTTLDQAIYQAHTCPAGPVHLNFMFREPLAPLVESIPPSYVNDLLSWLGSTAPLTRYQSALKQPGSESIIEVSEIVNATRRGIISVGRLNSDSECKAVLTLINRLQWPVFADILSGLRLSGDNGVIIHYFDQVLLSELPYPETILHIGGELTSKRFLQFIEKANCQHYIVIKDHPFRHDALYSVSYRLDVDIQSCCLALANSVDAKSQSQEWLNAFTKKSDLVYAVIVDHILPQDPINELSVAHCISITINNNQGLWLASSMPIRDIDMYASRQSNTVHIGANRGTSGIEGTIAAAVGFAVGLQRPVTLIVGDVAFLHDINSLSLLKKSPYPLVIIVINNNGGGIFSFLPIAQLQDVFEDYFATPHQLRFELAAKLFSIPYFSPKTNAELVEVYRQSISASCSTIIEVFTDRKENHQLHHALQKAIKDKLENR